MMIMGSASWYIMGLAIVVLLVFEPVEGQNCPDCCPDAQHHKHTTYNSQTTVLRQITPPLIVCTSPPYISPNKCTHPPRQFKFTCPPVGKCNPYRFTTPIPCRCTTASTCEPSKICNKMRPRCNCASRLASKFSSHVAQASVYAAKASSHAAEASSLAAEASVFPTEAFEVSTPRSPARTTPPRGSCSPHFAAGDAKHAARQETKSIESQPQAKRPLQPSAAKTDGPAVSTVTTADLVTAAGNVDPEAMSIVSQPPVKRTTLIEVKAATPAVSSILSTVPTTRFTEKVFITTVTGPTTRSTKKVPEGKSGPYLAAEAADRTARQTTRSTGILPEAKRSTQLVAETADSIATTENAKPVTTSIKYRPQSERSSKYSAETATPTVSSTPKTVVPTTTFTKKVPEGKCGSYLAAEAAQRTGRRANRSTGNLPEAKRTARQTGTPTVRAIRK